MVKLGGHKTAILLETCAKQAELLGLVIPVAELPRVVVARRVHPPPWRGGEAGLLIRKHDHYHAEGRNQTTRKGTSPQPPRGVGVTMERLEGGSIIVHTSLEGVEQQSGMQSCERGGWGGVALGGAHDRVVGPARQRGDWRPPGDARLKEGGGGRGEGSEFGAWS
jgi:hypothetical protein